MIGYKRTKDGGVEPICDSTDDYNNAELLKAFDPDSKRVAKTTIGISYHLKWGRLAVPLNLGCVSTVFLVIDHQYGAGPPVLFETMVFGGLLHQEMERYHTEAEAIEGHKEMVRRVLFSPLTSLLGFFCNLVGRGRSLK